MVWPGRFAVTRPVCVPVVTIDATPGVIVPHATCAATGLPLPSRIVAPTEIVSPTNSALDAGVTVTVNEPSVTVIGTSPLSGCSVIDTVGLAPGRTSIVTAPL